MNSYTESAWKKSGEHEPGFLLEVFYMRLGTSRHMVIPQALERPGTGRPCNDMPLDAWMRELADLGSPGDVSSPLQESIAEGSYADSSLIDIGFFAKHWLVGTGI